MKSIPDVRQTLNKYTVEAGSIYYTSLWIKVWGSTLGNKNETIIAFKGSRKGKSQVFEQKKERIEIQVESTSGSIL